MTHRTVGSTTWLLPSRLWDCQLTAYLCWLLGITSQLCVNKWCQLETLHADVSFCWEELPSDPFQRSVIEISVRMYFFAKRFCQIRITLSFSSVTLQQIAPGDYFPLNVYHYFSNTNLLTGSWSLAWHKMSKSNFRHEDIRSAKFLIYVHGSVYHKICTQVVKHLCALFRR